MTRQQDRYELPELIAPFAGEINDLDTHESLPVNHWVEEYGASVQDFVDAVYASSLIITANKEKDDAEINPHNVWKLKMEQAPGAFDFERRIDVMDYTGIDRQLMYPGNMGLFASSFYNKHGDPRVFRTITGDRKAYARKLIDLYNDWCVRLYRNQSRLRPVAILVGDTTDDLIGTMKKLIDQGVRLFQLQPDLPPAGLSPADRALDPFWALAADAGTPILAHIGANEELFKTLVWREAEAFKGWMAGGEFSLDPWTLSNIHLQVQNFLTTMVLGGVFDRHPKLRFGTAEFTGHWVGPFAENMDRWYSYTPFPTDIGERRLKMRPSDYIRRNVRVACFDFEPVGQYIDRFGFEEVLCFASDFPHHEGGKAPMETFAKNMAGQSPDVLRKFFVENGKLILPD